MPVQRTNVSELEKKFAKLSKEEQREYLLNGTNWERLAAIPYFNTRDLIPVLKDADPQVRAKALSQIKELDELYEVARYATQIAELTQDTSNRVQKQAVMTMQSFIGSLHCATDEGNITCERAYHLFQEAIRNGLHCFREQATDKEVSLASNAKELVSTHQITDNPPTVKRAERTRSSGMDI